MLAGACKGCTPILGKAHMCPKALKPLTPEPRSPKPQTSKSTGEGAFGCRARGQAGAALGQNGANLGILCRTELLVGNFRAFKSCGFCVERALKKLRAWKASFFAPKP